MKMLQAFPELVAEVRRDHQQQKGKVTGGHDFTHALMVAQYCLQIADEPLATLAWVAAICHNTDRLFRDWNDEQVAARLYQYLSTTDFSGNGKRLVVDAVLNHSKRPSPEDGPVTVILMDADKLGNLGYQVVIRAAQHRWQNPPINLHYIDPGQRPPGTSFKNPGSVWWDLQGVLEWEQEGWIRTPKARELAKPLFDQIRQVIEGMIGQYQDTGLIPYPFPEDFKG